MTLLIFPATSYAKQWKGRSISYRHESVVRCIAVCSVLLWQLCIRTQIFALGMPAGLQRCIHMYCNLNLKVLPQYGPRLFLHVSTCKWHRHCAAPLVGACRHVRAAAAHVFACERWRRIRNLYAAYTSWAMFCLKLVGEVARLKKWAHVF